MTTATSFSDSNINFWSLSVLFFPDFLQDAQLAPLHSLDGRSKQSQDLTGPSLKNPINPRSTLRHPPEHHPKGAHVLLTARWIQSHMPVFPPPVVPFVHLGALTHNLSLQNPRLFTNAWKSTELSRSFQQWF